MDLHNWGELQLKSIAHFLKDKEKTNTGVIQLSAGSLGVIVGDIQVRLFAHFPVNLSSFAICGLAHSVLGCSYSILCNPNCLFYATGREYCLALVQLDIGSGCLGGLLVKVQLRFPAIHHLI